MLLRITVMYGYSQQDQYRPAVLCTIYRMSDKTGQDLLEVNFDSSRSFRVALMVTIVTNATKLHKKRIKIFIGRYFRFPV